MFWEYIERALRPIRVLQGKIFAVKMAPQRVKGDISRVKGLVGSAKQSAKDAKQNAAKLKDKAKNVQDKAKGVQGQAGQAGQQMQQWGPAAAGSSPQQFGAPPQQFGAPPPQLGAPPPGYGAPPQGFGPPPQFGAPPPGAPGFGPPGPPPGPPPQVQKVKKMGLFGRKVVCQTCGQPQDKTWDQCPFCLQQQAAAPPPPGPAAPQKTMAFMVNTGGGPTMQLLGWLVPIKGAQRGELFTLKANNTIGTDPGVADVVLIDPYMSSRHAIIKAQGGVFVLEDLGSTNGTYVNDKKVSQHELVDNDFVKFGQTLVKFKSL